MPNRTPHVLVLATSLNAHSKSRILADYAHTLLMERGVETELLDLRDLGPLPFAGSPGAGQHPGILRVKEAMRVATHLIMAVPMYNFAGSAAAKNVIELMGSAELEGKTVAFLCAAGGPRSYMGILGIANPLMLDFRCWIVPRFVHATRNDVADGVIISEEIKDRITLLTTELFERTHPEIAAPV
jgi:FMN reductase